MCTQQQEEKGNEQPQGEVNNVATALTARSDYNIHLSSKEDKAPSDRGCVPPAIRLLNQAKKKRADSDSDCSRDDELDNTDAEADEAEERSRPAKRKRPSSSHAGPAKKKHKHYLQQCSTRQRQPRCTPQWHCTEARLPSLGPSAAEDAT